MSNFSLSFFTFYFNFLLFKDFGIFFMISNSCTKDFIIKIFVIFFAPIKSMFFFSFF